jgi:hypothetical protein
MSAFSAAAGGQRRIRKIQLLALLPVSIAAVVNCGYQCGRPRCQLPGAGLL